MTPPIEYFEVALKWLSTEFGKTNILSAVIHKDEAAQHMHVLIIPFGRGRMRGADLMGGPGIVRDRHARFVTSMQQPVDAAWRGVPAITSTAQSRDG